MLQGAMRHRSGVIYQWQSKLTEHGFTVPETSPRRPG